MEFEKNLDEIAKLYDCARELRPMGFVNAMGLYRIRDRLWECIEKEKCDEDLLKTARSYISGMIDYQATSSTRRR